jgi:hypothetical protein
MVGAYQEPGTSLGHELLRQVRRRPAFETGR